MAPYNGWIMVGVVHRVVTVGTEHPQFQVFQQTIGCIQVNIEMSVVLVLLHGKQRIGIVDPECIGYLTVGSVIIDTIGIGGVEGV